MSFNRLTYDHCRYSRELNGNTSILGYVLDTKKFDCQELFICRTLQLHCLTKDMGKRKREYFSRSLFTKEAPRCSSRPSVLQQRS